jgi:hypothetical protein
MQSCVIANDLGRVGAAITAREMKLCRSRRTLEYLQLTARQRENYMSNPRLAVNNNPPTLQFPDVADKMRIRNLINLLRLITDNVMTHLAAVLAATAHPILVG